VSADPSFARPAGAAEAGDAAGLGELSAQYELLAEAGRGGSAVVYRARDRRLLREVALKTVRLAPALDERERASEIARLAREARMTARLDHPHIVSVYAVHEMRDGLAVAMQFVPGRSLKQLLAAEGALDPAHAVRLLGEVAGALAYAHAHGVVHRDVKPENIFVDAASGRALLADFGAARSGDVDVRVTRTGVTVGTPAYMSPEQIDGGPVDGRADLYALGLVAWEALTGRRPWEGAGLYQTLHHQKHDVLPPIAAVRPADRPAVPPALEYVVARLLEKRPAARWASAEVAAEQLARPALPGDYKQWQREYRRRLAGHAGAAGRPAAARASTSGPVSTVAHTEQFTPDEVVAFPSGAGAAPEDRASPGAAAAPADDLPSWARPPSGRRWWVPAAAGAAALLAAVPLVARRTPARPAPAALVRDTAADRRAGSPASAGTADGPGAGVGGGSGALAGGAAVGGEAVRPPVAAGATTAPAGGVGDTSRLVVVASPAGAASAGAASAGAASASGPRPPAARAVPGPVTVASAEPASAPPASAPRARARGPAPARARRCPRSSGGRSYRCRVAVPGRGARGTCPHRGRRAPQLRTRRGRLRALLGRERERAARRRRPDRARRPGAGRRRPALLADRDRRGAHVRADVGRRGVLLG
jgi:tRNA A-37 threonylcarbamoyl transferase component Bud32